MASPEQVIAFEVLAPDATTALAPVKMPPDGKCFVVAQCSLIANVAVRYRADGTDPTSAVGMELAPGEILRTCASLDKLKFIGVNVNAKINITYYPWPSAETHIYG